MLKSKTAVYLRNNLAISSLAILVLITVGIFGVVTALDFSIAGSGFAHADGCDPREDIISGDGTQWDPLDETKISITGIQASVSVQNVSQSGCSYDIHLSSFNVFDENNDANFLDNQKIFENSTVNLNPGDTIDMIVEVPTCRYQVDIYDGPFAPQSNPDFANPPLINTHTLFDWSINTDLPLCDRDIEPASITIIKTVINDDEGSLEVDDFPLFVDNALVTSGVSLDVLPVLHQLSEDQQLGYTASVWSGDCNPDGSIIPQSGGDYVCYITNDDIDADPESPTCDMNAVPATINEGGSSELSWNSTNADSASINRGIGSVPVSGSINVSPSVTTTYIGTFIGLGGVVTCSDTVTVATINPDSATLALVKIVENNHDGDLTYDDFELFINSMRVYHADVNTFEPGLYQATEQQRVGYEASDWYGDCNPDGSITLEDGGNYVCYITNSDIPTPHLHATLTVNKEVRNDNEGDLTPDDFPLFINQKRVENGSTVTLKPGVYTLSEENQEGYTSLGWAGDCTVGGTVFLTPGSHKSCTITNDDNPVYDAEKAKLKLIKEVRNDDGGSREPGDFKLFINGKEVKTGESITLDPGVYTASEENLEGYESLGWSGDCTIGGSVVLLPGDRKTCTIINDDKPQDDNKDLEIEKSGPGTTSPGDEITYTITVTNTGDSFIDEYTVVDNVSAPLTYISSSNSSCVLKPSPNFPRGKVVCKDTTGIGSGDIESLTLTFIVDDDAGLCGGEVVNKADIKHTGPSIDWDMTSADVLCEGFARLTLVKHVENNHGGVLGENDFPLFINQTQVQSGIAVVLPAGVYTASEQNQNGYTPGDWSGACSTGGSVTLFPGDDKVCHITNHDGPGQCVAPEISLPQGGQTIFGTVGSALSFTIDTGGSSPVTVSVGDLPDGLSFDSGELEVFGTPTEVGTFEVTVHAENLCGKDEIVITIEIVPIGQCIPPTFVSPSPQGEEIHAIVGQTISYTVEVNPSSGFSMSATPLPTGLSFDPTTNVISGVLTQVGSTVINVSALNLSDTDCSAETVLVITVTNGGGGCTSGCGGGSNPPKVVVFGIATTSPFSSQSFVYLNQVPYTGLGLSVLQIILFTLLLIVIAGVVAYVIVRFSALSKLRIVASTVYGRFMAENHNNGNGYDASEYSPEGREGDMYPDENLISSYDNDSREEYDEYKEPDMKSVVENTEGDKHLESLIPVKNNLQLTNNKEKINLSELRTVARDMQAIISDDGLALIRDASKESGMHPQMMIKTVVDIAKTRYPREGGWLALDRNRVKKTLFTSFLSMIPFFVEWLVDADDKKVFSFLRSLRHQGHPVHEFLRKVVTSFDNVYKSRIEGVPEKMRADQHVADIIEHLPNKEIEQIIIDLLGGVDESYDSRYASVRLSVVRVLGRMRDRKSQYGDMYEYSPQSRVNREVKSGDKVDQR